MESCEFLEKVFYKINDLENTINFLEWDQYSTYSKYSLEDRIEQINTLEEIKYEIITSDVVGEMLHTSLGKKKGLNDWSIANLHNIQRVYNHVKATPIEEIKMLTRAKMKCKNQWLIGRYDKSLDSKDTLKCFDEVLKYSRNICAAKSEALSLSKYDTVLDVYDSDLRSKDLDAISSSLGSFFRENINAVLSVNKKHHPIKFSDKIKQKELIKYYFTLWNLDVNKVKIFDNDIEVNNNYTTSNDIRLLLSSSSTSSLRDIIKFSLQNSSYASFLTSIPEKWNKQPVGQVANKLVYQINMVLLEKNIGTCRNFIEFIFNDIKEKFAIQSKAYNLENLYLAFNKAKVSCFLQASDEFTGLAHLMLRYSLEKELIDNKLQVQDLSDAWAQGMQHYFNITPKNDFEGFLQDDVWLGGNFGQFPAMIMATVIATQLFNEMENDILDKITTGDLSLLIGWCKKYLYKHGAKYTGLQLLKKITNKGIDPNVHKEYLVKKYLN